MWETILAVVLWFLFSVWLAVSDWNIWYDNTTKAFEDLLGLGEGDSSE